MKIYLLSTQCNKMEQLQGFKKPGAPALSLSICAILDHPLNSLCLVFSPVHLNGLGPMISEDQPKINLLEFTESFHCHSATYLQGHVYIQQR